MIFAAILGVLAFATTGVQAAQEPKSAGIETWNPENDVWEPYNLNEDWSQAKDLAAKMPEKVAQVLNQL